MRTVEDIARILGNMIEEDNLTTYWLPEEPDYIGVDGSIDLIDIVKKLQALGIIESSEDNG